MIFKDAMRECDQCPKCSSFEYDVINEVMSTHPDLKTSRWFLVHYLVYQCLVCDATRRYKLVSEISHATTKGFNTNITWWQDHEV